MQFPLKNYLTVTPTALEVVDAKPNAKPARIAVSRSQTFILQCLVLDKRPYHAQLAVE